MAKQTLAVLDLASKAGERLVRRRLPVRRELWTGQTDDESDVLVEDEMYENILDRHHHHKRRHKRNLQRALERLESFKRRRREDDI